MLLEKRSTRFGAALIIFAVILRLIGAWEIIAQAFRQPEIGAGETPDSMIRDTTGAVHPSRETESVSPEEVTSAPPVTAPEPEKLQFFAEDMQYVRVEYASDCKYRPDLEALLGKELDWGLSGEAPTVLIIHSHSSESYTKLAGQSYSETANYRTLNEAYNMIAVGDLLTKLLTEAGIAVVHDRQIHDYPSYTEAYNNSRSAVREYLIQYPTIQVVLDLHRDAALNPDGSQYATSAVVNGEKVAQLMLVVGSNASGSNHPGWQENLAAAVKLQAVLEKNAPGITRQTILRAQRFNQDLSAGALIVEVGSAGNTLQEAFGAVPVLAQALVELMYGANRGE